MVQWSKNHSLGRLVMYEQLAPFTWLSGAKLPELPLLTELALEAWLGGPGASNKNHQYLPRFQGICFGFKRPARGFSNWGAQLKDFSSVHLDDLGVESKWLGTRNLFFSPQSIPQSFGTDVGTEDNSSRVQPEPQVRGSADAVPRKVWLCFKVAGMASSTPQL